MTHYQYTEQPWPERAQAGTRAVQSARPTGVSQPVFETQSTGRLAQQPSYAGTTGEVEAQQPSRQETAQFVSQPTQQAGSFSPPRFEPRQEQAYAQPRTQPQQGAGPKTQQQSQPVVSPQIQPRQVETPKPQPQVQPVAQPQVQARQVEVPEEGRLVQPAVSTQQLPTRTGWVQQELPARPEAGQLLTGTGSERPAAQSAQTVPAQQTGSMQMVGGQIPSGGRTAGAGQAAAQAQPTGGEQTMAAQPEAQAEQQSQVKSLTKGMPSVDIYETPDELVIFADVPGCKPEDVELLGNENSVTLVANRGEPSVTNGKSIQRECVEELERTIPLPARADIDEAEATVEDGVCRITLPKSEDDREKRIGIQ